MRSTAKTGILLAAAAATVLGGCAQVRKFRTRADMVTPPTCTDFSVPIYFREGSHQLTPEAVRVIDGSRAQIRACKVAEVNVTGLADADGSPQRNMALSKRRADEVARVLARRGWPTPAFDLGAAGEAGAATVAGEAPMRRQTQISVKFASPTPLN